MNSEEVYNEIYAEENLLNRSHKGFYSDTDPSFADKGNLVEYEMLIQYEENSFVQHLYSSLLNRNPDDEELYDCLNKLKSKKVTKDDLMYSLALSDEGLKAGVKLAGVMAPVIDASLLLRLDDEAFLRNSYIWILGREVDNEGLNSYLKALSSGRTCKEIVLHHIIHSPECRDRNIRVLNCGHYYLKRIRQIIKRLLEGR